MSYAVQMNRMGTAVLDFGTAEHDTAIATISVTWVTAASIIICQVGTVTTADHDSEDPAIEAIQARAINIVSGVSFDIMAYAPGGSWGQYVVGYSGLLRGTAA